MLDDKEQQQEDYVWHHKFSKSTRKLNSKLKNKKSDSNEQSKIKNNKSKGNELPKHKSKIRDADEKMSFPNSSIIKNDADSILEIQRFVEKVINAMQNLRETNLFKFLSLKMETDNSCFSAVVCLGVGNFSTSNSSFWQFVLYLCLRRKFLFRSEVDTGSLHHDLFEEKINDDSFLYEPTILEFERRVCKSLGVYVSHENLFGQCKIANHNNEKVLFFMPHCPYQLYCNLIWTNCTDLDCLCILGNR